MLVRHAIGRPPAPQPGQQPAGRGQGRRVVAAQLQPQILQALGGQALRRIGRQRTLTHQGAIGSKRAGAGRQSGVG